MPATVRVLPSSALDASLLAQLRELVDAAFGPEDPVRDTDWEHALGGVHAIAWDDGGVVVAHAALVERRLEHDGRTLRAGYVEAVATRPGAQGKGFGAAVMAAVETRIAGGFDLGALGSTDEALGFYGRRGWQVWRGPLAVRGLDGRVVPTPDEAGGIHVLPAAAALDLDGSLVCDWRPGDVW